MLLKDGFSPPKCFILYAAIALSALYWKETKAEEDGSIAITYTGDCGKNFLSSRHGRKMKTDDYVPKARFNRAKVKLSPKSPRIPGCFKVIIKNVKVLGLIKRVTTEFEMRIAGSPDPKNPTISCSRKEQTPPACGCGRGNPCLFCGFCQNLRRQRTSGRAKKWYAMEETELERCACREEVEEGTYDIQTEICTQSRDDIASAIPSDQLALIGSGKTVSMFTSVILYDDFTLDRNLSDVKNRLLREILEEQRNRKTIGCFQIGLDVKIDSNDIDTFEVNRGG